MEWLIIACTFAVAALLSYTFSRPSNLLFIVDTPNERSLHQRPTPKTGGLAIFISFVAAASLSLWWLDSLPSSMVWILLGAIVIALISFLDDCYELSAAIRFIIHLATAVLVVWQAELALTLLTLPDYTLALPYLASLMVFWLFIAWMTNLYNFMDGMDGFAGGMAVFGFGTFAVLGYWADAALFMWLNGLVVAASLGFLVFNFPPAKLFMGDVGSTTLGFLAACFSLWGQQQDIMPLWVAVLVFTPFSVDATVTLLRRLSKGEKVWQAHRSHYYQRLVRLGWGHKRTVLAAYIVMGACSLSALLAVQVSAMGQWGIIIFWMSVYPSLMHSIARLEQRATQPVSSPVKGSALRL